MNKPPFCNLIIQLSILYFFNFCLNPFMSFFSPQLPFAAEWYTTSVLLLSATVFIHLTEVYSLFCQFRPKVSRQMLVLSHIVPTPAGLHPIIRPEHEIRSNRFGWLLSSWFHITVQFVICNSHHRWWYWSAVSVRCEAHYFIRSVSYTEPLVSCSSCAGSSGFCMKHGTKIVGHHNCIATIQCRYTEILFFLTYLCRPLHYFRENGSCPELFHLMCHNYLQCNSGLCIQSYISIYPQAHIRIINQHCWSTSAHSANTVAPATSVRRSM